MAQAEEVVALLQEDGLDVVRHVLGADGVVLSTSSYGRIISLSLSLSLPIYIYIYRERTYIYIYIYIYTLL